MHSEETMMMDPLQKEPDSGDLVQGYQLGQLLGRGAHGSVFLANKPGEAASFALKIIDTQGHPKSFVDRIVRECAITTKLRHPGIISVYEAGYWGSSIFIVMDVANGRSCDNYTEGVLGWELSIEIIRQVGVALNHAYTSVHVIHRDIKPANIVVDIVGGVLRSVKVVDFGLSRAIDDETDALTMTGMVLGTPFFMSPEQARGDRDLTFHTDLYALGATLFFLIAGRAPFNQGSAVEILVKHCNEAPPELHVVAPTCPPEISKLVARCLAKEPAKRFASYGEFIKAIEGFLVDNPFESRPTSGATTKPSSRYSHRVVSPTGRTATATNPTVDDRGQSSSIRSDALGDLFRAKLQETTKSYRRKPIGETPVPPAKIVQKNPPPARPRPAAVRKPTLEPGTHIDGACSVVGPLGAGAMGEVYAVRDDFANRDLALKILSDDDMLRPGAVRRFQGECAALATVEHIAFPFFAGKGSFRGRDYLLMERVSGIDLKAWMTKHGKMAEQEGLWVVAKLADAMDRAYAKCGMVHRDIKPANMMLTNLGEENLKLVDFGVSTSATVNTATSTMTVRARQWALQPI